MAVFLPWLLYPSFCNALFSAAFGAERYSGIFIHSRSFIGYHYIWSDE